MSDFINNFHFIRPWWLVALLPAFILWWRMLRQEDPHREWKKWVDPALLDALLVQGSEKGRVRPVHLLGIFLLLAIVAVAGPTRQREPSPFAEDEAALVIALKVTDSMEEDSTVKHENQTTGIPVGEQDIAGNPTSHAYEEHFLYAQSDKKEGHNQHEENLGHLTQRQLRSSVFHSDCFEKTGCGLIIESQGNTYE